MSDYPKAKAMYLVGMKLVAAVQDTFGHTFRQINGPVLPGHVYTREIHFIHVPQAATGENNKGNANFRVVEAVHPNTVRAVLRRAGIAEELCRGCWYRVIED